MQALPIDADVELRSDCNILSSASATSYRFCSLATVQTTIEARSDRCNPLHAETRHIHASSRTECPGNLHCRLMQREASPGSNRTARKAAKPGRRSKLVLHAGGFASSAFADDTLARMHEFSARTCMRVPTVHSRLLVLLLGNSNKESRQQLLKDASNSLRRVSEDNTVDRLFHKNEFCR